MKRVWKETVNKLTDLLGVHNMGTPFQVAIIYKVHAAFSPTHSPNDLKGEKTRNLNKLKLCCKHAGEICKHGTE